MTTGTALTRFTSPTPERLAPAEKEATLCAVFIETEDDTGLCKRIRPVRIGAHLENT